MSKSPNRDALVSRVTSDYGTDVLEKLVKRSVSMFDSNPEDIDVLYDELVSKLTGIYGKGQKAQSSNDLLGVPSWTGTMWVSTDGSVWAVQ